jgi:Protein of unknown function (DUF559)
MGCRDDADREIERLATWQHGVIARPQLLAAGLGRGAIDKRVQKRRLVAVHPGVYALGHAALRREGWWMAAALAYGGRAVLSHHTAAAAWELRPSRSRIDVSLVTADGRRSKAGTRLHRVRSLPDDERARLGPLPVTSLARTLLDLAPLLTVHHVEQAIHRAGVHGSFDLVAVRQVLDRHRGKAGAPRLAALLARLHGAAAELTRSELEIAFLALCDRYALPRPVANARIHGFEVDFHWPGTRLIVETDGRHHAMPAQRERDHDKRLILEAAGWRVIGLTFTQVTADAARTAARLRAVLTGG